MDKVYEGHEEHTISTVSKTQCSSCDGYFDEDDLVNVRECSHCETSFNATDEGSNNCPDCNRPFTRNLTKRGCPECADGDAECSEAEEIKWCDDCDEHVET